MIRLKIPATSSNLGPGFDVLGLALRLYLNVTVRKSEGSRDLTYRGQGYEAVELNEKNLIWRSLACVAEHERKTLPGMKIDVDNEIPIARGLGSSGAAVIAGVLIANEVMSLQLTEKQELDYALKIESHPDNISAALLGGLVVCCVTEDRHCLNVKVPVSPQIKAVVVVPEFELPTAKARALLPDHFSREDVVFNLQRVALLAAALGNGQPELIAEAVRDRIHQPYRRELVPGLDECLNITGIAGLLGIYLSGAGPSVLALATDNFGQIGNQIRENFTRHSIRSDVMILDIDERGSVVTGEWDSGADS